MFETAAGPSTSESLLRVISSVCASEAAWTLFFERYVPLIDRWCFKAGLQPADAEEVRSRVLTGLVKSMRKFEIDPAYRFRGWLRTVVFNSVRSYWRELQRKPGSQGIGSNELDTYEQKIPSQFEQMAADLDEKLNRDFNLAEIAMERVRERIEERTWEAFWRTAINGQPSRQVADELGLSIASVYMAKCRVAKLLRDEGQKLLEDQRTDDSEGE